MTIILFKITVYFFNYAVKILLIFKSDLIRSSLSRHIE